MGNMSIKILWKRLHLFSIFRLLLDKSIKKRTVAYRPHGSGILTSFRYGGCPSTTLLDINCLFEAGFSVVLGLTTNRLCLAFLVYTLPSLGTATVDEPRVIVVLRILPPTRFKSVCFRTAQCPVLTDGLLRPAALYVLLLDDGRISDRWELHPRLRGWVWLLDI